MTKQVDSPTPGLRDRPAIEITPQMIEAGVYAIRELPLGGGLDEVVRVAFIAMLTEASGH